MFSSKNIVLVVNLVNNPVWVNFFILCEININQIHSFSWRYLADPAPFFEKTFLSLFDSLDIVENQLMINVRIISGLSIFFLKN